MDYCLISTHTLLRKCSLDFLLTRSTFGDTADVGRYLIVRFEITEIDIAIKLRSLLDEVK